MAAKSEEVVNNIHLMFTGGPRFIVRPEKRKLVPEVPKHPTIVRFKQVGPHNPESLSSLVNYCTSTYGILKRYDDEFVNDQFIVEFNCPENASKCVQQWSGYNDVKVDFPYCEVFSSRDINLFLTCEDFETLTSFHDCVKFTRKTLIYDHITIAGKITQFLNSMDSMKVVTYFKLLENGERVNVLEVLLSKIAFPSCFCAYQHSTSCSNLYFRRISNAINMTQIKQMMMNNKYEHVVLSGPTGIGKTLIVNDVLMEAVALLRSGQFSVIMFWCCRLPYKITLLPNGLFDVTAVRPNCSQLLPFYDSVVRARQDDSEQYLYDMNKMYWIVDLDDCEILDTSIGLFYSALGASFTSVENKTDRMFKSGRKNGKVRDLFATLCDKEEIVVMADAQLRFKASDCMWANDKNGKLVSREEALNTLRSENNPRECFKLHHYY